jgi:predicted nucleic acid-binding protein
VASAGGPILDSSGLLAAIDAGQQGHREAKEALKWAKGPLILSPLVLTELAYMILKRYGHDEELALLGDIGRGVYRLEPFSAFDAAEARAVIEQYTGAGDVGQADASDVVLARRHDARDILTLDERRFRVLRGPRDFPFRVLSADL